MPTINQLSPVDQVSGGDQIPVYQTANGDARKMSVNQLTEFVRTGATSAGGIMGISSIFAMIIGTPASVSVGTSFANIPNWENVPGTSSPSDSVAIMTVLGEFVAQRDIAAVKFWCTLNGTWPTNRDLYLSVYSGTDALPYESAFKFIGAGRGGSSPVAATFSGIAANLNNPNAVIKAGEKIRLVAKMNTADTLNITEAAFAIQTLDGL